LQKAADKRRDISQPFRKLCSSSIPNDSLLLRMDSPALADMRPSVPPHVAAAGSETPHDRGADHTAVTRNINPLTSEIEDLGEHHIEFAQYRTLNRSGYGVPARSGP
jgi:hypothetical protein